MLTLLEGSIHLHGDSAGSRFYVRSDGVVQQHGAWSARLAVTAPLVERIAEVVTEWDREQRRRG